MKYESLSITTRGIGLGTCNLCYFAATAGMNIEPPMYPLYRVYLGLTEAKLRSCHLCHEGYKYKIHLSIQDRLRTVAIVPAPIKHIIDSIDVITVDGAEYWPVLADQVKDAAGLLVPRPENILLSNLRETVIALSTADTPVEYRAAFKANCPIPGAIWNNDLLLNADEIIPENYDVHKDLWNEMWPAFRFLNRLAEKYPLMDSGPLAPGRGLANVSKAALITSTMDDIRSPQREFGESVEQYCKRCYPVGDYFSDSFSLEKEKVSEAEKITGQMALLGEQPNKKVLELLGDLAEPVLNIHSVREKVFSDNFASMVRDDYMTASMQTYVDLLSQVVPTRPGWKNEPIAANPMPAQRSEAVETNQRNSRGRGNRNRNRQRNNE